MTAVLTERQSIKESVTSLNKRPTVALFINADWKRADTTSSDDQVIKEAKKLANSLGRVSTARLYIDGSPNIRDNIEVCNTTRKNRIQQEHAFILDVFAHSSEDENTDIYVLILAKATNLYELVSRLIKKNKTVVVVSTTENAREFPRSWPMFLVPLNKLMNGAQSAPPEQVDVNNFDFRPFISLLDETQSRLDFVGVKYFITKVMWRLGIQNQRRCQDVFQAAQERGIVEIFEQENIKEGGQPVSACRLNGDNGLVQQILSAEPEESKVLNTEDQQPEGTSTTSTPEPSAEVESAPSP